VVRVIVGSIILVLCAATGLAAEWWPRFRGPNGSGVCADGDFPTHFGPDQNVIWKVALPVGHSSPCIWGDRIFLTGYANRRLETLCLDRRDGQILWRRPVAVQRIEQTSGLGTPANATPATDGERVYVYFGSFGLLCYDLAGNELWRFPLPPPLVQHGSGTSPIVAGGLVLLACDQDVDACLLAVDCRTGRPVWRAPRPDARRGFCTPAIWHDGQRDLVILPGTLRVAAYDLAGGREVWTAFGLPNEICSSPVMGGGLLFVNGWTQHSGVTRLPSFQSLLDKADADHDGRISRQEAPPGVARAQFPYADANKDGLLTREEWESLAAIFAKSENALLAVRPGGEGNVTATDVAWKQTRGLAYVPTPLFYRDRLYVVKNGGRLSCFNAATGAALFLEERLGAAQDYYSSPVAANGKICVASQSGKITVFAAADSLTILARNDMGEPVMATPAIVGNRLYLRTAGHLYAFGDSGENDKVTR
jgi:outer membrane protein assembly factor BamB